MKLIIFGAIILALIFLSSQSCDAAITSNGKPVSYYDLLQVSSDVSDKDLKKQYRRKALEYHPDKISPDASEEEKAERQQLFIRVSNAYEVLSDPIKRQRYDLLVSRGIYEYEEREWNGYQESANGGGPRPARFRDARSQFADAEAEANAEMLTMLVSFGIAGMVALIPLYRAWKKRRRIRQQTTAVTENIKQEQKMLAGIRKQLEAEALAAAEAAAAAEEEEGDEEEEEEAAGHQQRVSEEGKLGQGEDGEEKEEQERGRKKDKGGSVLMCIPCHKKFKSEQQLANHEASNAHKKAVAAMERKEGQQGKKMKPRRQDGDDDDDDDDDNIEIATTTKHVSPHPHPPPTQQQTSQKQTKKQQQQQQKKKKSHEPKQEEEEEEEEDSHVDVAARALAALQQRRRHHAPGSAETTSDHKAETTRSEKIPSDESNKKKGKHHRQHHKKQQKDQEEDEQVADQQQGQQQQPEDDEQVENAEALLVLSADVTPSGRRVRARNNKKDE